MACVDSSLQMISKKGKRHEVNTPCEDRIYCATHIVCHVIPVLED
jgi:hypothetical protein